MATLGTTISAAAVLPTFMCPYSFRPVHTHALYSMFGDSPGALWGNHSSMALPLRCQRGIDTVREDFGDTSLVGKKVPRTKKS